MRTTVRYLMLVSVGLILLGLIFTSHNYAQVNPDSFAGLWTFDEGEGNEAKDSSGNGNDGEFVGNPAWVEGKFGNALQFDGSSHVDCGDSRSLDIDGEALTLMAWVKPNTTQGLDGIIEKECGANAGYNLYLDNGKIHFRMFASGNVAVDAVDGVPNNSWSHIAAVYDGSKMKVYIDGEFNAERDQSGNITTNDIKLAIGASSECGRGYDGAIDEVAILNIALSEDEISDVMKNRFPGVNAVSPNEKLATTWGRLKADG